MDFLDYLLFIIGIIIGIASTITYNSYQKEKLTLFHAKSCYNICNNFISSPLECINCIDECDKKILKVVNHVE